MPRRPQQLEQGFAKLYGTTVDVSRLSGIAPGICDQRRCFRGVGSADEERPVDERFEVWQEVFPRRYEPWVDGVDEVEAQRPAQDRERSSCNQ